MAIEHSLNVTEGETLLYISSDLPKELREQYIKIINENDTIDKNIIKFVAMTSSASRGLSFKPCNSMHIILQDHCLESYLMELMQAIYRPRGKYEYDKDWIKKLHFYYGKNIYYSDKEKFEFETNKRRALLDITTYLFTLRTSILTRIQGYGEFEKKKISLIPVGGTHVDSVNESMQACINSFIRGINYELARIGTAIKDNNVSFKIKEFLNDLKIDLIKCFEDYTLTIKDELGKNGIGSMYKDMMNNWDLSLSRVVDMNFYQEAFTVNSLLVTKLKPATAKESISSDSYKFKLEYDIARKSLIKKLNFFREYKVELPNGKSIQFKKSNLKLAEKIITLLRTDDYYKGLYHNKFNENSSSVNRYVAIPIYALTSLYEEFTSNTFYEERLIDGKVECARTVMEKLINLHTPCYDVGPVSDKYVSLEKQNVPYITFSASNLKGIQESLFSKNYTLCSNEVNVFNLLVLSD